MYDNKRQIVFCRTRGNADRSALYVHDIFIESDIKNEVSVLPPDITALKAETAHGVYRDSELMRNVLKIVYAVKPENVSKVVNVNGEPKVMCHGFDAMRTEFEMHGDRRISSLREIKAPCGAVVRGQSYSPGLTATPSILEGEFASAILHVLHVLHG